MKKIFIYILLLLSICLVACKSKADIKPSYSIQSNSDGYIIGSFDISDIKIKITEGDKVTYVPVSEDMLDRAYSFNKPGNYAVTVSYENFSETIIIIMKENPSSTGDGDNSGDNGGKQNPPTNGYKEISEKYLDFSGAALTDRCSLESIGTTLYVGNTFGLENDVTYVSSDPTVIKINENNVLICLKKGTSMITVDGDERIRITVEELVLTADTYYSTIGYLPEMEVSDIKTILHNLIDDHVSGSYALLKTILPLSDADPNDPSKMILLYTGRSQGGTIAQNNEPDGWNREHVWPLSKLGGDTGLIAGHDAHHIRPADVSVNKDRGNLEFGLASTIENDTYAPGSSYCKISSEYFEPRDEVKGDIARMLFYMAVRYEGDINGEEDLELVFSAHGASTFEFGNLALLLEWNRLDPVDDFERNRNNVIYSYQKNRNPFIDYPSLADLIWSIPE